MLEGLQGLFTSDGTDSSISFDASEASSNIGSWTMTAQTSADSRPTLNIWGTEYSSTIRRGSNRRRRDRIRADGTKIEGPLMLLSDEDYAETAERLQREYEEDMNRRRRENRRYILEDEENRRNATREYWEQHRRENRGCDCERCQLYRGQINEASEDVLGW